jgi:L-methionine (R)-S-oxide reductase
MNSDFNTLLAKIDAFVASGDKPEEILYSICSLLKDSVYHYDWIGFYILDEQKSQLVLGPFCGKPTEHTIIPVGKGVCGQVAENNKLKIVQDVSEEENYIACSLEVQSEIVVPILKDGRFVAEIDIDSHSRAPFTIADEIFLISACQKISELF